MNRGWKRLSAVLWGVLALFMLLRAPIWAILAHAQDKEALFWAAAVVVPLLGHLATIWILNGFAKRD